MKVELTDALESEGLLSRGGLRNAFIQRRDRTLGEGKAHALSA